MTDYAFYNVGCHEVRGPRKLMVLVRRMMRRVLRPIFLRQAELFRHLAARLDEHEHRIYSQRYHFDELGVRHEELTARQDDLAVRQVELAEQIQTTMAFGWDYVALVRRLATLEDHIAVLTGASTSPGEEGDAHPSILFPGLEKSARRSSAADDEGEIRSKVC